MGRPSVASLRGRTTAGAAALGNVVRRMLVRAATGAVWTLAGFIDGEGNEELESAEVWPGVGIWALPPSSGKPEALIVRIGAAAGNPAIAAVRDEKTRAAIVARLGGVTAGEHGTALLFNSGAVAWLKGDGGIELRAAPGKTIDLKSWDGTAQELSTRDEVQALRDWALAHIHPVTAAPGNTGVPAISPPAIVGTTVLKGE